MRKDVIMCSIVARTINMAIWALICITSIFSNRMPITAAIVLRTLCAAVAVLKMWGCGNGVVDLLKQLWRKPERRHVTVDLKRGTVTETK